jgi:3'-phosphoadenosine 5'-phosphosulfate sulfotransferase (PAPS reductase)/FAD synthetase
MKDIQEIKRQLKERISGRSGVLLLTGDKGSTLLLNLTHGMNIKSVFIDTGFHFDEILEYIKGLGREIEVIKNSNVTVVNTDDMLKCCYLRKIEPLKGYLNDIKPDYLVVPFTEEEKRNGIEDSYLNGIDNIEIIRPLSGLTDRDIWLYIKENNLPFSALYKKGYKIIDCKSCTTRIGRKMPHKEGEKVSFDSETIEKLKSLGYM